MANMVMTLELKEIVSEASQALAGLDAERLEEMAISCQALNRSTAGNGLTYGIEGHEAAQAARELVLLGRILEATRQNLGVLHRLRQMRAGRLEYDTPKSSLWMERQVGEREAAHGND